MIMLVVTPLFHLQAQFRSPILRPLLWLKLLDYKEYGMLSFLLLLLFTLLLFLFFTSITPARKKLRTGCQSRLGNRVWDSSHSSLCTSWSDRYFFCIILVRSILLFVLLYEAINWDLRISPSSSDPLKFSHHMVEQDISAQIECFFHKLPGVASLLQESDKGQIFYWSIQTCSRIMLLFDRLSPCSKNLKTALFKTFSTWHPNTFCLYCLILT